MINPVHEDDLAAWYQIPEPVGEISISDFELEDDDVLLEGLQRLSTHPVPLSETFSRYGGSRN
jgi:hypothetical protein